MIKDLTHPLPPLPEPVPREPVEAVIALGANLGDREATFSDVAQELERLPFVENVRMSPAMRSVAITLDGPDPSQPEYLNAVALITTRLAPSILLGYLHRIEAEHGRERRKRWGNRTLDLDLISYGSLTSDDPALLLPHPRAAERDFVLQPWLSIDPDAQLTGHGSVAALLERLRSS